jgi:hypothetical protein
MVGAGEFNIVFETLIRFFCIDFRARDDGRVAHWEPHIAHASTLVALRQSQRILDSRVLAQIELALLRLRLFINLLELDEARNSGRIAMAYVRLLVDSPDAALAMVSPGPVRAFREDAGQVPMAMFTAQLEIARSFNRNELLDILHPPTPSDSGSDSEDGTDDA